MDGLNGDLEGLNHAQEGLEHLTGTPRIHLGQGMRLGKLQDAAIPLLESVGPKLGNVGELEEPWACPGGGI